MPVPASYNDVTEDKTIRDHVGLVWYDRTFYVPEAWRQSSLVWLRFGSVHYAAQVVSMATLRYVVHQFVLSPRIFVGEEVIIFHSCKCRDNNIRRRFHLESSTAQHLRL
jgi:hypothetical protein